MLAEHGIMGLVSILLLVVMAWHSFYLTKGSRAKAFVVAMISWIRHKKTKCWINGESTSSNVESISRNIESTLSISKVNQSRVESTFEKNTVPIRLLMI
jgi:hypothetical protein